MQDGRALANKLEIVIASPEQKPPSKVEWNVRNLAINDLESVCRICREAFPLDYSEKWFEEVGRGF
jgi:hypothetical protein